MSFLTDPKFWGILALTAFAFTLMLYLVFQVAYYASLRAGRALREEDKKRHP